jgi:hypothetical protein
MGARFALFPAFVAALLRRAQMAWHGSQNRGYKNELDASKMSRLTAF